jgi:hypothetical protein
MSLNFARACWGAILVAALAACGGDGGNAPEGDDEVSALEMARNLRMGKYKLDQTRLHRERGEDDFRKRQEGTFLDLELSSQPSRVSRQGSFVARRLVVTSSGKLAPRVVRGGWKATTRRQVTRLQLISDDGDAIGKYIVVYVGDSMVLGSSPRAGEDLEIFLKYRGDGSRPVPVAQSCVVKELENDNVFEEGLSIEEYPDVSFEQEADTGKWHLSIGSWSMTDGEDGDTVEVTTRGDESIATVKSEGRVVHTVTVRGSTGTVKSVEDGAEITVATLHRCRRG